MTGIIWPLQYSFKINLNPLCSNYVLLTYFVNLLVQMNVTVHSSIRVKFAVKSLSTSSGKTLQDRLDPDSDRFDNFHFLLFQKTNISRSKQTYYLASLKIVANIDMDGTSYFYIVFRSKLHVTIVLNNLQLIRILWLPF